MRRFRHLWHDDVIGSEDIMVELNTEKLEIAKAIALAIALAVELRQEKFWAAGGRRTLMKSMTLDFLISIFWIDFTTAEAQTPTCLAISAIDTPKS
jgi:hypothetical protein